LPPASSNDYAIFGLRLTSEIALPELPPGDRPGRDVTIRRGQAPADGAPVGYSLQGDAILLNVPDIARYRIVAGREVIVDAADQASDDSVRLYLMGSALGAILHQRGLLPLHANAIEIDGRAVAFMGRSGAGKSTLAAWFLNRGYPVLTDDVCVVENDTQGPVVHAGIPRLRLSPDALAMSGRSAKDYRRAPAGAEKFHVPTGASQKPPRPVPLAQICLLNRDDASDQTFEVLQGVAALDAMMANTYRGGLVDLLGATERHLADCLALVRTVPVMRITRPWDAARFDELAQEIEAQVRYTAALAGPIG
jgi:hypothetical protein